MNSTKRCFAVGRIIPILGPVIVSEQDVVAPTSLEGFLEGYLSAIAGAALEDMWTPDAVEGWHYARRCAGSKHNEDDGATEDDYEFISRGGA